MKKKTGFTLTELVLVAVIIIIFIALSTPVIGNIREKADIIGCEENLQKIGLALRLYANENQGKFPPNMEKLVKGGYLADEKVFDCPGSPGTGNAKESDYHYVTGYSILSPSDSAVVFDKDANHNGGRHVLYVSGKIAWENTD